MAGPQNLIGQPLDLMAARSGLNQVPLGAPVSPAGALPTSSDIVTLLQQILIATKRQANFTAIPWVAGTTAQLLRQHEDRRYVFILNQSATNAVYIGFGYAPTATNGFVIPAGGYYEPYQVPVNDLYVLASSASTNLLLLVGLGP